MKLSVFKINYFLTCLFGMLMLGTSTTAQTVLARAEANPSVIMVGDSGTYAIRFLNADSIPNLNTPRVAGLEFGSAPSNSSYRQIINGQISVETEISWPFRPTRTGTYIIPGRTVEIDGEPIRIPEVEVKAVPMDEETRSRAYLIVSLPDPPYYVGQSLPARVSLLVRRDLNISSINFPQCLSDAFQHTEFANSPRRGTLDYQGRPYNALVWDIVITPIKSGPAELQFRQDIGLQVITRNNRFPSIFNMTSSRTEPVVLNSEPVTTDILTLPRESQPDSFSGAIGQFNISADLAETELTEGEPVTLTLSIEGTGNFDRITPLDLPEWPDWRIYPPKVDFFLKEGREYEGRKTFEYILIPQSPNLVEVPGFDYATFDPASGSYRTTTIDPIPVTVEVSDEPPSATPFIAGLDDAGSTEPVVPERILPLKPEIGYSSKASQVLWKQTGYWLTNGAVAIFLLAVALVLRRRLRLQTDDRLARRHSGSRRIRKALQTADAAARGGEAGAFLEAARYAVQEALSHLSTRPVEARTLVTTDCLAIISGRNLPVDLQDRVQNLLATADAHQFAGATPDRNALLTLQKDLPSIVSELSRAAK